MRLMYLLTVLFKGALYVLLNNRMLFLIVHYWEVMVDVWPVIVQVVTPLEIISCSSLFSLFVSFYLFIYLFSLFL